MQLTSVKPPSVHLKEQFGPQLDSLGAKLVDTGIGSVEARVPDPKTVAFANAAISNALAGIDVRWTDSDGNGVRGFATGYDVVDGIAKLAGVERVGAFESLPLQISAMAKTTEDFEVLSAFLRSTASGGESINISDPAES